LLEVVGRLTSSLNSFACLEESAPLFVGAGFAFLTASVAPGTLIVMLPFKAYFRTYCIGRRLPSERM
jgi:hypothetical protein